MENPAITHLVATKIRKLAENVERVPTQQQENYIVQS